MKILKEIINHGLAYGADEVQVSKIFGKSKTTAFENNSLKTLRSDESSAFSVKTIVDKKMAVVSTNNLTNLKAVVEESVLLAKNSEKDEFNSFPENSNNIVAIEGLKDDTDVSLADTLDAAKELVNSAVKFDPRVVVENAEIEHSDVTCFLANSKGLEREESRSYASFFILGMATDGKEVSSFDFGGGKEVFWNETFKSLLEKGRKFANGVVSSLGAKPAPSGKMFALLSPDFSVNFLSYLDYLISARRIQENVSRFKGMLNKKVASEVLSIIDSPHKTRSPFSEAFDAEGVPTQKLQIIKKGILEKFIYDTYSAKKEGCKSTGNSFGGTSLGLHAPEIEGTMSLVEMKKIVDKGVFIKRYSGDINPISGVCSGVLKGGKYMEKGENVHSVTDTMINADYFEMLNNIVAISFEKEMTFSGPAPYVLIKNIDVIGK